MLWKARKQAHLGPLSEIMGPPLIPSGSEAVSGPIGSASLGDAVSSSSDHLAKCPLLKFILQ